MQLADPLSKNVSALTQQLLRATAELDAVDGDWEGAANRLAGPAGAAAEQARETVQMPVPVPSTSCEFELVDPPAQRHSALTLIVSAHLQAVLPADLAGSDNAETPHWALGGYGIALLHLSRPQVTRLPAQQRTLSQSMSWQAAVKHSCIKIFLHNCRKRKSTWSEQWSSRPLLALQRRTPRWRSSSCGWAAPTGVGPRPPNASPPLRNALDLHWSIVLEVLVQREESFMLATRDLGGEWRTLRRHAHAQWLAAAAVPGPAQVPPVADTHHALHHGPRRQANHVVSSWPLEAQTLQVLCRRRLHLRGWGTSTDSSRTTSPALASATSAASSWIRCTQMLVDRHVPKAIVICLRRSRLPSTTVKILAGTAYVCPKIIVQHVMASQICAAGNALCELLIDRGSPDVAAAVAAQIAERVPAATWAVRRRAFAQLADGQPQVCPAAGAGHADVVAITDCTEQICKLHAVGGLLSDRKQVPNAASLCLH